MALQLWVETGAADESADEAGLAHLLEHVLFRGSAESGTGKLAAEVEKLGGTINGFTSRDHTVYHLVLPAKHLTSGLKALAQLTQLPPLEEPQLQKEKQVVLEEWKQGQDNPRSQASSALFKAAFRVHPYGRPVIGTPESLKRITWEALSRFYERRYTTKNMILVLVGDFEAGRLREETSELFGPLRTRERPERRLPAEPEQREARVEILKGPVRQSHLMLGFPIPRATDRDAAALDLLAFILGRGESSRLVEGVKTSKGLVSSISASAYSMKEPGLFTIQVQLETEKNPAALEASLQEIYRLREEPVSPWELSRAHVNFERSFVQARETMQGQAQQLGSFTSVYGDPNYSEAYLKEIRQLSPERLMTVARTFFKTEGLSVSLLLPEGTASPLDADKIAGLSRSLTSASALSKRSEEMLSTTLDNGLTILIQEDHRLPVFAVHAGMIGGLLLEDERNNGIHNFIAAMLTQGTPRWSSGQLVRAVEQLGGNLNGSSGRGTLSLSGTFPSREAQPGLEIFLDVLLHPGFPQEELEKKRQEILLRIKNRDERSRDQALRFFYQSLFRNHPYRLEPSGQRESVIRLRREDLLAQYQKLLSPERLVLTIVGDVDGERLLNFLRGKLSSLRKSGSIPTLPAPEAKGRELRVEKKTIKARQAHLVLGFSAPAKGDPDYFTMKVLEAVLSRLGGRLFVELRDKQGLAYSVGAFSLDDPHQGAFGIYTATDPAAVDRMKDGIIAELRRLQGEEVSAEELERAKNYLIGNYLIARQTNAAKAADLVSHELFGFGSDFTARYQEAIEKVAPADILKFAKQYLPLDRYVFTIVGP